MPKTQPVRMSEEEVMAFLAEHGSETAKATLVKHGAREPFFGTRIGDMKPLVKKIKRDHELSLALYETGNSDAMYLAGLIADETRISREELERWVRGAYWYMLAEATVAWVAAESNHGFACARAWIDDPAEMVAAAGWATWSSLLSIRPNEEFDDAELAALLDRVRRTIHGEQNRVRYAMNSFVIALGSYHPDFTERARQAGEAIGKVHVDMGGTACKVPLIAPYIAKIEARGGIGKKRTEARC